MVSKNEMLEIFSTTTLLKQRKFTARWYTSAKTSQVLSSPQTQEANYFKLRDGLPNPNGPLSLSIPL